MSKALSINNKVLIAVYSYSGVSLRVAESIREMTSGIIFPIETVNGYAKQSVIQDAKKELKEGRLPELKQVAPDMSSYDAVLVGGPVWWYTVATPVMSFLRDANFQGKPTAAFCTHEGGVGNYFADFALQAKSGLVMDGLDLFSPGRSFVKSEAALEAWLKKILN